MKAKALLCLILSFVMCLSLFSCKKEEEPDDITETETIENAGKTEEKPAPPAQDEYLEYDILGEVESWLGHSSAGPLTDGGIYETYEIQSSKDLDPFRSYLYGFSAEDEQRILGDVGARCLLIEMTGDSEHTLYATANILQQNHVINLYISKTESEEEIIPLHTYFLFYFSSQQYHGEEIIISF